MYLLSRIERHLRDRGISASRFGREAMGDPGFVHSLRRGRLPHDATLLRIEAYLDRAHNSAKAG